MSKVFILGMSPLPFENDRKVYGTGVRTWQFMMPLLNKGHGLCVCNYAVPSAYPEDFNSRFIKNFIYSSRLNDIYVRNIKKEINNKSYGKNYSTRSYDIDSIDSGYNYSFEYNILKKADFENIELLSKIFLRFKPDCIVGCTFYPSYVASKLLNYLKNGGIDVSNINDNISSVNYESNSVNKNISEVNRVAKIKGAKMNMGSLDSNIHISKSNDKFINKAYQNNLVTAPFWADLFGHVMAEAQARAYIDGDDSCLFHYWNSEYNIISSADKFSCVSSRQEYALIGELGAAGRLNRYTSGYKFSCTIPCGIPQEEYRHTRNVFRQKGSIDKNEIISSMYYKIAHDQEKVDIGKSEVEKGEVGGKIAGELEASKSGIRIGKDDFVVLWTGGYNTWTDVDTLFKGLTLAMKENPKIKFVSTGGEIPEQDTKTYPGFLKMIENSHYRDRFIMKGWIAGEDVPNYYLESDVGINIDKDIYEVKLGSKNRILDWMRAGLCVLSSNVCELTEIIDREKIGYTFKAGSSKDLSKKLLYLASHPTEVKRVALAGKKYGFSEFNFNRTTEKLQKWVENPAFSPDSGRDRKIFFDKEEALKNMDKIVLRQKKMIEERDRRVSELEGIVKKSFTYRLYSYLKIIKRKLSG